MRELININHLVEFAEWLEEQGYLESDWRTEQPYAVDEFIRSKRK